MASLQAEASEGRHGASQKPSGVSLASSLVTATQVPTEVVFVEVIIWVRWSENLVECGDHGGSSCQRKTLGDRLRYASITSDSSM